MVVFGCFFGGLSDFHPVLAKTVLGGMTLNIFETFLCILPFTVPSKPYTSQTVSIPVFVYLNLSESIYSNYYSNLPLMELVVLFRLQLLYYIHIIYIYISYIYIIYPVTIYSERLPT